MTSLAITAHPQRSQFDRCKTSYLYREIKNGSKARSDEYFTEDIEPLLQKLVRGKWSGRLNVCKLNKKCLTQQN